MDKKTIPVLVLLFAGMLLWPIVDKKFIKPLFPAQPVPAEALVTPLEGDNNAQPVTATVPVTDEKMPVAAPEMEQAKVAEVPEKMQEQVQPDVPENTYILTNEHAIVTISSYGACIKEVVLNDYPEVNTTNSGSVHLDFSQKPALRYQHIPGLSGKTPYTLVEQTDASIVLERKTDYGLTLTRTLTLGDTYEIDISDTFYNGGQSTFTNTQGVLQLGPMEKLPGRSMKGLVNLGVDVLAPESAMPIHFGKKFAKDFGNRKKISGRYPLSIEREEELPIDWVAVKNKYFVQILVPENGGDACVLFAAREISEEEKTDSSFIVKRMPPINEVAASLRLPELLVPAGETHARSMKYYVGPKKYKLLSALGLQQEGVMEFATTMPVFRSFNVIMVPIKSGLLWLLNFVHDVLWPHNYGIAIIIITILIRILFWPVTHKSTESMKRMQELAPLIAELKEKYKGDQQKVQQATMALYKEHKVNPLGGCLPMVIQIPVFIALFSVLRNAIELRFAHFLWIANLSEPENLFADVLPIPLNILPLIMVATQFIQQKMTPTSADPQQAKMMQFLPLMFLFFFYNMPSGLVLYWTTNTCLMIIQQLYTRRKQATATA